MGYNSPIGGVTRHLNATTTVHATSFSILKDYFKIGNRMAIIQVPTETTKNKVLIWSSIPVADGTFDKVLDTVAQKHGFSKGEELEVVAAVLPNRVHDMAAIGLKEKYPNIKLIGPYGANPAIKLDYTLKKENSETVVKGEEIDPALKNFEFLLLNSHANKEVITFDKNTKTIFESDFFFNVPYDGKNTEQFPNQDRHSGLGGFVTQYLNNQSKLGRFVMTKRLYKQTEYSRKEFQLLNKWDFENIILSHGNIVEKDAKKELLAVYGEYLN